jgi:type III pantothenate kinase
MRLSRLLTLDLGNTALTAGVWEDEALIEDWSSPFSPESLTARLMLLKKRGRIDSAILSSVVPRQTDSIISICKKTLDIECRVLNSNTPTGLKILYREPESVGADRIANAVGAYHVYGGPVIVVDFGTAITFDVISNDFEYLGGVIAPGLNISTQALFSKAALLPEVEISIPDTVLGQDTVAAIRSGVFWGTLGLVERIILELKKELGWGSETKLVATGGHSALILSRSSLIEDIDPFLTLRGLYLIAEKIYATKTQRH